jgi:hypothetical protein
MGGSEGELGDSNGELDDSGGELGESEGELGDSGGELGDSEGGSRGTHSHGISGNNIGMHGIGGMSGNGILGIGGMFGNGIGSISGNGNLGIGGISGNGILGMHRILGIKHSELAPSLLFCFAASSTAKHINHKQLDLHISFIKKLHKFCYFITNMYNMQAHMHNM